MEAIDRHIRSLQALSRHRDTQFAGAAAHVGAASLNLSVSLPIGTRVLDSITGQTGTVVNGKRENVIIPDTGSNGS